ncbi:oligosaccharide flippase family protein [Hymenobacter busanensis]|uniref:Oligosaccharide flippase family protein n=1 Tax=Hymenobacter busanensis TaxID=2607656 RepID=A0A7L4ZTX7_9BACT|nr:oligosaccharide flippase family protein [Hymenobacter busanensis]KAA9339350.1 oligosaccharide flippase family protein [Hymenobacter busanensis]QHJ06889.1 oligosaccharide flippase family protein [Hymenobacter busanensis]
MLLNLLIKPGWVVVENLVQDRLGHAAFGTFTALYALTLVLASVSDLGLTQHTTKRVAAEPSFLPEYFPTVLPLRGVLSVVFLGVMLAVGWVIGYRGYTLTLLALVGGGLLLTQYAQFLRGAVQAHQHFNTDAWLSVFEKALLLGLVVALLPVGITLTNYIGARTVASAFTFVLLYALVARLFGRVPWRLNRQQAGEVLRGSLPFALITLLYGLNERIDMVMLERLASPQEAGYYAGAYRWVDAVMMYLWTVLPLFFAKFAHALHRKDEQRDLLWFGQRVATVPLLIICAFVLFRGEVLFWQFKHSSPEELARMTLCLRILFVNVLVHAFFAIYSTLLTSTSFERPVSWLVALSIALNVGLNFVLLPRYGAVAGAVNTLICAVLVSVGYVTLVYRRAGVAVPWALLGQLTLSFGGLCAVWYSLQRYWQLPWLAESIVAGLVFVALLFITRVVRVSELRPLLKRGG